MRTRSAKSITPGHLPGLRNSGFTLIELSVVLIIIALVTSMAVSSGVGVLASARQAATVRKMKAIDQALMAYRVAKGRLPCPGDLTITPGSANFGVEAGGSSVCTTGTGVCKGATLWAPAFTGCTVGTTVSPAANFTATGATYTTRTAAEGALPVVTLGLPNDMMVDGWGNRFRYAVDTGMTILGSFHDSPVDNTCGPITVEDTNDAVRKSDAIYALISHGPNGHGAYTNNAAIVDTGSTNANELLNCHCSSTTGADNGTYAATYVQALPSIATPGTTTTTFDDIVTYKERWQMQTPQDPVATLYIADGSNSRIRKVTGCTITTVAGNGTAGYAGDGAAATSAELNGPADVTVDSSGNLYIADEFNYRIRKVTVSTGIITTVAGNGTSGYSGDGAVATSAKLSSSPGLALDSSGNLYIADEFNNRIRKVTAATGIITTVAGNGTASYSGDGGQATNATLSAPIDTAIDGVGNIYIADYSNNRIRKVTAATGVITTVAGNGTAGYTGDGGAATSAELLSPHGVTVDNASNIYIADSSNDRIRKVTAATGIITTIAGNGTFGYGSDSGGTSAVGPSIAQAERVAVDSGGNIYVSDFTNSRIRKITATTGIVATVAGISNSSSYSGDGKPATSGTINLPIGITVVPSAAVSNR